MNTTVNVSLPEQLKKQAQQLIENGHFVSFSDLTRSALRRLVADQKDYDKLAQIAWKEYDEGKAVVMNSKADIENFVHSLVK